MEDSVSAAITVSASVVTMVTSAREVCDGFGSFINETLIEKKKTFRKTQGYSNSERVRK